MRACKHGVPSDHLVNRNKNQGIGRTEKEIYSFGTNKEILWKNASCKKTYDLVVAGRVNLAYVGRV